jgi:hypothetical protein
MRPRALGLVKLPLGTVNDDVNAGGGGGGDGGDTDDDDGDGTEIDYVQLLNRLLPDDIRVTAWAPVEINFDARCSDLCACVRSAYSNKTGFRRCIARTDTTSSMRA